MASNELLDAALKYASEGYHIFPCLPGQKGPATPRGFHDATRDHDRITAWWTADPTYNVAISLEPSGVSVVDLDEWTGLEEWASLEHEHGRVDTHTVSTPRGGNHLYFRGELRASQHKLGSKIDTRGIGSYVLVPPSSTDAGCYRLQAALPLANLPPWIPATLATLKRVAPRAEASAIELDLPHNIERAVTYLKHLAPVRQGEGADSKTIAVACKLRDLGLSPSMTLDTMRVHYDCAPVGPKYHAFLERKIENAYKYAENTVGIDATGRPQESFAIHIPALLASQPRPRFKPYNETEMDNLPEPTWLIPNLLPDQETAIIYGPSGSFKSFVALDLALSVAAGVSTFAGSPTRTGLVFYVALEGKHNLMTKRRSAWRLARSTPEIPGFFVMNGPTMGEDETARQEFCDSIRETSDAIRAPVAMIVVDTGAKMMAGTNENDARDAGAFVAFCDHLRETFGCAILAVLHSGKESERGIRGSSAIYAGFDTVIALETERQKLVTRLRVEKHKDAEERATPWYLRMVQIGGSLVPSEIQAKDFRETVEGNSPLGENNIARTLLQFKAGIDGNNALTTHVLVSLLFPLTEGTDVDENERNKRSAVSYLNKAGKDKLAAYCDGQQTGQLMWRTMPPSLAC